MDHSSLRSTPLAAMFDGGGDATAIATPVMRVRDVRALDAADSVESPSSAVALDTAIAGALEHLASLQTADGHWCAELEGDSILQSDYVMLLWFLGLNEDPRIEMACRTLRASQLDTGGWAIYPGGPPDPSASVKAYFVLKLFGDDPVAPHMQRACTAIRSVGGVANANSFTKIYLAMFQQLPWNEVPAVPPELILTPRWFLLNISEMSAWSRAIVVPLAMIWALKPCCSVPVHIDELVTGARADRKGDSLRERFWFAFFRGVDRAIKLGESLHAFAPVRAKALAECERWTLQRLPQSAGLAAIVPAIANAAVALRERGHSLEEGPLADQLEELRKLELVSEGEHGAQLRLQPCCSPVWDTALSIAASLDAGATPENAQIESACRWLLDHEVKQSGDWTAKVARTAPSGWYFEYANEFYPDCDDTAEVLSVLQRCLQDDELQPEVAAAVERGSKWLVAMQNRDGGWGAFDRGCDRELLTFVPFADHNAMIDPSTADVSARAVEAIAARFGASHDAVQRGASYLESMQEEDGSWYGRWGCNYLYGTWLAVSALSSIGRGDDAHARRGAEWLLSVQLESGGWGESLETYADPSMKGQGPATVAQTAWAMLGLLARLRHGSGSGPECASMLGAVERGVAFLQEQQRNDGGWCDEHWTGTGFPQVFYLRYHYYDRYFPLQALAQYRQFTEANESSRHLRGAPSPDED